MKSHLRISPALVLGGRRRGRRPPAAATSPPERTIAVSAKRFEFEPKEIRLRKGEAVMLEVTSQDVAHGFFSRTLISTRTSPPERRCRSGSRRRRRERTRSSATTTAAPATAT